MRDTHRERKGVTRKGNEDRRKYGVKEGGGKRPFVMQWHRVVISATDFQRNLIGFLVCVRHITITCMLGRLRFTCWRKHPPWARNPGVLRRVL